MKLAGTPLDRERISEGVKSADQMATSAISPSKNCGVVNTKDVAIESEFAPVGTVRLVVFDVAAVPSKNACLNVDDLNIPAQ